MAEIKAFIFNYFYENTYVVYDDSLECIIIDPGCCNSFECNELDKFITLKKLKPVRLINTHCHIDHIFGNKHVADTYNLPLEVNALELDNIHGADSYADRFSIPHVHCPEPSVFLNEGDKIQFGHTELEVIFVPGHSAGHIAFYCPQNGFILSGDVLFYESIGRTDLPGGNYETLMQSIHDKMLTLPDATVVYSGHGTTTTIGHERLNNPFILEQKWEH